MIKNISGFDQKRCVGCRSCEQICPKQCITMQINDEGFLYPIIKTDICVFCGLCLKHCPVLNDNQNIQSDIFEQRCFALKIKDKIILKNSSSGGAFSGFALSVLKENGIVFGAAYSENLYVNHISVNNDKDLELLNGSKYVSSDTVHTYSEVKKVLKTGRYVLYTGTPCQIAGLYAFLGEYPPNLLTIDLICHGTPSYKLFSKYLEWIAKKSGSSVIYYTFRNKTVQPLGAVKIQLKNGKILIKDGICDPYGSAFSRGETYRECCYICPYANMNRVADITIGDFWGIKDCLPKFDVRHGVSACIINTGKGLEIFTIIFSMFDIAEVSSVQVSKKNYNLNHPSIRPKIRSDIYAEIDTLSPSDYFQKFKYRSQFVFSLFSNLYRCIGYITPEFIKDLYHNCKKRGVL